MLGLGYVGCVTAACFASLGHRVMGIDRDQHKVDNVLAGRAPFYEPGLEAFGAGERDARPIVALSTSARWNRGRRGRAGLRRHAVGKEWQSGAWRNCGGRWRKSRRRSPGAPSRWLLPSAARFFRGRRKKLCCRRWPGIRQVSVVSNPEFLREGSAVQDFLEPSLVVVGGNEPAAVRQVADLYAPLGVQRLPGFAPHRGDDQVRVQCVSRDENFFRQ